MAFSAMVTVLPARLLTGRVQVSRGLPSTSAAQQPQIPCGSQPGLSEMWPRSSRSTFKAERLGSVVTDTSAPFRVKLTFIVSLMDRPPRTQHIALVEISNAS